MIPALRALTVPYAAQVNPPPTHPQRSEEEELGMTAVDLFVERCFNISILTKVRNEVILPHKRVWYLRICLKLYQVMSL